MLKEVTKTGAKRTGKPGGDQRARSGGGGLQRRLLGGVWDPMPGESSSRAASSCAGAPVRNRSPSTCATSGATRHARRTEGQAYGADTDQADVQAFEDRGRGDRHQFRFIVAPEDGLELEDLQGFTRELMHRMAIDLETRLDWVAVDHWDTDNPHTHVVLRGRTASGEDLVIAPDYMAYGMRMRASEIATEWLGPRTELEIRQSLLREADQQRLTGLDQALIRQAGRDGCIDLTGHPTDRACRNALRARLQRLEEMGSARTHWTPCARGSAA